MTNNCKYKKFPEIYLFLNDIKFGDKFVTRNLAFDCFEWYGLQKMDVESEAINGVFHFN